MFLSILDNALQPILIIDEYESLIWTTKYSKCGDFELLTNITEETLELLAIDNYVVDNSSEVGMIIERREIKTDPINGNKLIVSGRSLEFILDRRIVWGQKVITGNLQDGIESLLDDNIISPTDGDRIISNFIFIASADPLVTALTADAQYSGNSLYDVICSLCDEAGLGFKIQLVDGNFEFTLYSGVDRTYSQTINPRVIFSPTYENISNSVYVEDVTYKKTIAMVTGEGEGSNREVVESEVSAGLELARRETYLDASSISQTVNGIVIPIEDYIDQLIQEGVIKLEETLDTVSFEGIADFANIFVYAEDFNIGDIVELINEYGMNSQVRLTEMSKNTTTQGVELRPTFIKV